MSGDDALESLAAELWRNSRGMVRDMIVRGIVPRAGAAIGITLHNFGGSVADYLAYCRVNADEAALRAAVVRIANDDPAMQELDATIRGVVFTTAPPERTT